MTGTWIQAQFLITEVEADFIKSCCAALCYRCVLSQSRCAALELQLNIADKKPFLWIHLRCS